MKLFTVDEANALIDVVAPLLEEMRGAQEVMESRHADVMHSVPGNGGGDAGSAYLQATFASGRAARQLEEMGIVVRDPSTGLIDFPSERDGETIYLCWRLGETTIEWWHPTDSGFSGRRPL